MTDRWDEICTLFEDAGVSRDFQAGYVAAITEVSQELERLLDLQDVGRDSTMDIYDLKRWLNVKLKEQP